MYRFVTGIAMYGLCFCAPPIPFLLMGRPFAAILNGVFWFFSLQLLSSGNQGGALLLYLVVVGCVASTVRQKRTMNRESKRDNKATSLFRKALDSERKFKQEKSP